MPALRALELQDAAPSDEAAAELFRRSSAGLAPEFTLTLCLSSSNLPPAAVRMVAASGWRLEGLELGVEGAGADIASLEALGSETWSGLRRLYLYCPGAADLDAPFARALAAALRRMPALRALTMEGESLSDAVAVELFRAAGAAGAAPLLRALRIAETIIGRAAASRSPRPAGGSRGSTSTTAATWAPRAPRRRSPRRPLPPSAPSTSRTAAWTSASSSIWPPRPGRSRS
jgi:hypothetical protein